MQKEFAVTRQTLLFIAIFTVCGGFSGTSFATKPEVSINGNPIGNRDNYTINSTQEKNVSIECAFVNSGSKPAVIEIWSKPSDTKPIESIQLMSASKAKPFQVIKQFHFTLKNKWWCRIYTPHKDVKKWRYCAYFSISDGEIVEYNPFATWDKTIKSKDASYHCRIKKPDGNTSFFYFKK